MTERELNREKSRRRRIAHDLGLVDVRLWVKDEDMQYINDMFKEHTEGMIAEEYERRFGK